MYAGHIVEYGTTDEIFYQPGHEYTKGLINSIPKLNTEVRERLVPIEGTPVDLLNPPAGCPFAPRCKNCMKICLSIGDTIRVSLTGDPLEEIKSAKRILKTLGLRKGGIEVVSCPTCGRTQIDLIGLANQVETLVQGYDLDIKVAVMGCVVNGPGEAKEADLGVAGGKGVGILIKKGEIVKKVPESELLSVLKDELDHWGK